MYSIKKMISLILAGSMLLAMSSCASKATEAVISQTTVSQSTDTDVAKTVSKITDDIHIDQIGYKSDDNKIAVINGKYDSFEVVDSKSSKAVMTGKLSAAADDESSGDTVCYADFSDLKIEGSYYITVPELGKSYEFKIGGKSLYKGLGNAMLKALYYQRCGIALDKKYAGQYTHDICHKSPAKMYDDEDKEIDVSGGWHDAGDYGKYVVPAAMTAADLLLAYEFYPGSFTDNINIPESTNKMPDILDEAKYGIEWMLKMQDKSSGGVYHKVTSRGFPDSATMPEADIDDQLVMPVSTNATADFAAVTAMAARVFKDYDAGFSQTCIQASEKAWGWLENNKKFIKFTNPQDVTTGEYSDDSGDDEKSWAAAELFRATDNKKYSDYFVEHFEDSGFGLGWQNVSGFAAIAYMFSDQDKTDKQKVESIKKDWLAKADMFAATAKKDGYLLAMHKIEYSWGSNMNVTNHSIHMLIADKLKSNTDYTDAVKNSAHYLLGRNTLNQSYITGYGTKQVMQPHHRPSTGDGIKNPVPGFIVGGPDSQLEDDITKSKLSGKAPAKCYIDDMSSYSTNEVSTYWNSSALFILGYLNSQT